MFKVSTFCAVAITLLLGSRASGVLQLVAVAHPPYCDYHTFCDVWVDHQASPWVGWVDQVGNPPAFPQDEAISSSWVGTTSYTPSPGRDNSQPGLWPDDPNIPNVVVAITNLTGHPRTNLVYVSMGTTGVGNWDFGVERLNPNTYMQEGFSGWAFLIDNNEANRPLISESMDIDGVFQPGETWEFVIQDYTNSLGLSPAAFGSAGMGDPAVASGTIIPEPATMGLLALGGLALLRRRRLGPSRRAFLEKETSNGSRRKTMFKVSTFCAVAITLLLGSQASGVVRWVTENHGGPESQDPWPVPPHPYFAYAHELGNPPAFPQEEAISSSWVGTTSYTPCPQLTDDPNIPNVVVSITNQTSTSWPWLVYVEKAPQTGFTNCDYNITFYRGTPEDYLVQEGYGNAFQIDANGNNRPLISESMDIDGIFQPEETWEFVIQDYTNSLGLSPAAFGSVGMVDPAVASGTIIPEPATMGLLALGGLALLRRRT